jgi:hypothetical protein
MASEWVTVATFGGGLNFSAQPQSIQDNEWSWCNGFIPDEQGAIPLPLYSLRIAASYFAGKTPPQTVFGLLMNPFSTASPLLILTYETTGTDPVPVHFYTSTGDPAGTTEITWDGVGTRPTRYTTHRTAPSAAFLNGWLVITAGSGDVGYSLFQWNGGTTFSTIIVGASFRCAYLESFGGHLIGAAWGTSQADMRRIKISDANSTTVWIPGIDNSADDGVLDDSLSGILGLVLLNNNMLGIFTRTGLYALSPTGNIPPYTRAYVGTFPLADGGAPIGAGTSFYVQTTPLVGETPSGVAHVGYSNLWISLATPIGTKIWRYLSYQSDPPDPAQRTSPRILWHHRLRTLIVSTIAHTPPADGFFYYNALTEGWGWQSSALMAPIGGDQAMVYLGTGVGVPQWTHLFVDAGGNIYGETGGSTSRPGIYVDTKDFAMPAGRYVDAIKVDWEPLTASTQLEVRCLTREGMSDPGDEQSAILGTPGFEQNLTNLFANVPDMQSCVIPGGASEQAIRARGKFVRFRFQIVAGVGRIRGFAFRHQMASDRLTDVRLYVSPTDKGIWNQTHWNTSKWSTQ